VEIAPRSVDANLTLGKYYLARGRLQAAEEWFVKAASVAPRDALVNRTLALYYLAARRPAEAEKPLQTFVEVTPDPVAALLLADYYFLTDRTGEARTLLESRKGNKAVFGPARLRLAALEFTQNRHELAFKLVEEILAEDAREPNALLMKGRFEELARLLLGDGAVPKGVEYFNKPPKIGRPTPPHQDGYYFMIVPNEAATFWVALEEVDAENGCLRYVRGSHRRGIRSHRRTDTLGFSQGVSDYGRPEDAANEVAFSVHPGDVLVHHSLTIHRADGNTSDRRTRQAIGLVYYSGAAREDKAAQQAYQQQLQRELAAAGKI